MSLINCPECKKEISNRAVSCPNCGYVGYPLSSPLSSPQSPTKLKNRNTAILLALLLGGIGVHKFYLDRPGVGLIYIIFCWTFIPAIIGLIEAIQFACMDDKLFQQRYINKRL